MTVRTGIFAGACPFTLARNWLGEAEKTEINDPNAIALSTVDAQGMPNARVVLLKAIEDDGFVFYTNYTSAKGQEVEQAQKAAFVMHWKSLRRQVRVWLLDNLVKKKSVITMVGREIITTYLLWLSR